MKYLYLKKTQLQNLQKLDITDATLSTAALSNLKHILSCMPMLKSVETNNLDVYSILPLRISRVTDDEDMTYKIVRFYGGL